MAPTWLPYAGRLQRSERARLPSSSTVNGSPLLTRPPATSLRPAVAFPSLPAAAFIAAALWAGTQSAPAPRPFIAPPVAEAAAEPPVSLSGAFPDSVRRWDSDIRRWAGEFGLPVDLVAVVMTIESCGDPSARSRAGAQGLFQVMPFHFAAGEDPLDPEVNARRGLNYLSRGLSLAGGNTELALAGYNGGHGLITRAPAAWPSETLRYVRWGTGILQDLAADSTASPTLQAWLDAGGASLCRRADGQVF